MPFEEGQVSWPEISYTCASIIAESVLKRTLRHRGIAERRSRSDRKSFWSVVNPQLSVRAVRQGNGREALQPR